jgi:hypothetical protein
MKGLEAEHALTGSEAEHALTFSQNTHTHTYLLSEGNSTVEQQQQQPLNIEILAGISEFMVTPGDIGRPPEQLAHDFPQVRRYYVVCVQLCA